MKAKVIKTGETVDVYHEPQHGQITNIYKESVLVNGQMWSEDELDFCRKANEAPKSKFVYPDKLYARTNNNITLDISYAPQTLEAVEYVRTDAFIEKAEKFFEENIEEEDCKIGSSEWTELRAEYNSLDSFIRAFVEYMEGE